MYKETKDEYKIVCSRCGSVTNPTESWEWEMQNGDISLTAGSCIDWDLLDSSSMRESKVGKALISGKHPIVENFGFQKVHLEWGYNKDYRICHSCHKEFTKMVGDFFLKSVPEKQPIFLKKRINEDVVSKLKRENESLRKRLKNLQGK